MANNVTPMIHVPDVRAAVDWYRSIGFTVINTYGNDGDGLSFAILSFGNGQVMFSQGGQASTKFRREVDLYVNTENIDDLYQQIKNRVEIVEKPHDTFYGMRELIVRDLNRFWVTFGQPSFFAVLMTGVQENNVEIVRTTLESRNLKPETLASALAIALADDNKNTEIIDLLRKAGAVTPREVDVGVLHSYAGVYNSDRGFGLTVICDDGKLFAAVGTEQPRCLLAVDETTFRPLGFEDFGSLTFEVEDGKTAGCVLKFGSEVTPFKRV